jgi:GntR family transcriptional regulator/MocR family aminotransferase
VLPPRALSTFLDYKWTSDRLSATLEQHALAELMRSGQYARHISRMRVEYGTRRAALAQALSVRFGSRLRLQGAPTGLHLVAHLESDRSSEQIAARAARMGARIYPADELYLQKTLTQPVFLLGYASMSADDLRAGIDIVASACE